MSLRIRFTAAQRRVAKYFSIAALGALGLTAFAAPAHAGPGGFAYAAQPQQAPGYGGDRSFRRYAGCEAGARRILGKLVRGTVERVVHRRLDKACELALMECRTSLENLRRSGKRFIRTAKCKVLKREHAVAAPVEYRCMAKAFNRNGYELSRTRAVRIRADERRACASAMQRCERRLDAKRWKTGRRYPQARCEVVRSREIAADRSGYRQIDYRY